MSEVILNLKGNLGPAAALFRLTTKIGLYQVTECGTMNAQQEGLVVGHYQRCQIELAVGGLNQASEQGQGQDKIEIRSLQQHQIFLAGRRQHSHSLTAHWKPEHG